jgi:hypothetical protein
MSLFFHLAFSLVLAWFNAEVNLPFAWHCYDLVLGCMG